MFVVKNVKWPWLKYFVFAVPVLKLQGHKHSENSSSQLTSFFLKSKLVQVCTPADVQQMTLR